MIYLKSLICENVNIKFAYHVTYLSNLEHIKKRGLLLPTELSKKHVKGRPVWDTSKIFLYIDYKKTYDVANHIGLNRNKDWVVIKVSNLDPDFIKEDPDWGDTPEETIKNFGTFSYEKPIPPEDISIFAVAKGTDMERHDEFRGRWL